MVQDFPRNNGAKIRIVPIRTAGQDRQHGLFVFGTIRARASGDQPHRQRLLLLRTGSHRARPALSGVPVRAEREGDPPVERVIITVDDDGPGIPPHALERIFERFYTDRPNLQGLRPELRPRAVDFAPDRRGSRRTDLGLQPASDPGDPRRRRGRA